MASFGKFDDSEFQKFAKQFDSAVNGNVAAEIMEQSMKKAIILVLNGVKKRTPVDSGLLRRSWSASNLKTNGKEVVAEITNSLEYAPSVEYGHRQEPGRYVPAIGKRLVKSYVPGQFMLTNTINDVQDAFDRIAAKAFEEYLERIMGD